MRTKAGGDIPPRRPKLTDQADYAVAQHPENPMPQLTETDSTQLPAAAVKPPPRTIRLLLLAVAGGAIVCLVWCAQYVPAITSELGGWLGRPSATVDTPEARQAQVIFLLLVYSAPLVLGAMVYAVSYLLTGLNRRRE